MRRRNVVTIAAAAAIPAPGRVRAVLRFAAGAMICAGAALDLSRLIH